MMLLMLLKSFKVATKKPNDFILYLYVFIYIYLIIHILFFIDIFSNISYLLYSKNGTDFRIIHILIN